MADQEHHADQVEDPHEHTQRADELRARHDTERKKKVQATGRKECCLTEIPRGGKVDRGEEGGGI